jgi:hypothetical protein
LKAGTVPGPRDPPEVRGRQINSADFGTTGGLPAAERGQGGEPAPMSADCAVRTGSGSSDGLGRG